MSSERKMSPAEQAERDDRDDEDLVKKFNDEQGGNIPTEGTESKIVLVTWNTRGFQKKLKDIWTELVKLRADIAFIQETHIGDVKKFNFNQDWQSFFTVYHNRSKGVAILVRPGLRFVYEFHDEDYEGSYIVLVCQLDGKPFTLVNVYNASNDTSVLQRLTRYLQEFAKGILVVGGDFNSVLNWDLDRNLPNKTSFPRPYLSDFISSLNLVDVWGQTHPADRQFTFVKNKSSFVDNPEVKTPPKKSNIPQKESQSSELQRPMKELPKTDPQTATERTITPKKSKISQKESQSSTNDQQSKTGPQTATRIDMFFVPYDAMQYVTKCSIESSCISDHNPVLLEICTDAIEPLRMSIHSLTMEMNESITKLPGDISGSEVLAAIKSLIGYQEIFDTSDLTGNKKATIINNLKCTFNKAICCEQAMDRIQNTQTEYLILTTIFSMRLEKYLKLPLPQKICRAGFNMFTMLTFKTFPKAINVDFFQEVMTKNQNDKNNFWICNTVTSLQCRKEQKVLLENSPLTLFILTLCLNSLAAKLREEFSCVAEVCRYRPCVAIYMDSKEKTDLEQCVSEFKRSSEMELNLKYIDVE